MPDPVVVEVEPMDGNAWGECALCGLAHDDVAAVMIIHDRTESRLCLCVACYSTVFRLSRLTERGAEARGLRLAVT